MHSTVDAVINEQEYLVGLSSNNALFRKKKRNEE